MSDLSPPIAPDLTVSAGPNTLLDLVGHLGAALIQSDKITDPVVIYHLQSAHRLALDLYSSAGVAQRHREMQA